ncbi:hypothetical protein V5N11_030263 [Cardamine amara subsp. amara]|uniref:Reverse transcriptase domain-containing protein n=1 Tax=Cardamine amara subsp. amara TaxID=228776 RepID=A0ABD0ZZJ1_CARAN
MVIKLFADDSLLFTRATPSDATNLKELLKLYEAASGQPVNYSKSAIIYSKGVSQGLKNDIFNILGIRQTRGFGKYLGLPESIG